MVSGKTISNKEMNELFKKKLEDTGIKIDASRFHQLFLNDNSYKTRNIKNVTGRWMPTDCQDQEEEKIVLGGVLIACSALVAVIQLGFPPAAPFCNYVSAILFTAGSALISNACEEKIWPNDTSSNTPLISCTPIDSAICSNLNFLDKSISGVATSTPVKYISLFSKRNFF